MNTPQQLIEAAKELVAAALQLKQRTAFDPTGYREVRTGVLASRERVTDAAASVTAAIEASTQDDWQDISNAPKDGTEVQLSDGVYVSQGHWWTGDTDGVHKWMSSFTYEGEPFELDPVPIFWMPLPNPPTAQPDDLVFSTEKKTSCQPDEQVCSTCGAINGEECRGKPGACVHTTTASPVPPPEGEVMPAQRPAKRQGKAEYGDAYTPPEMEIAADDPRFQLAKPPHREPSIDADQKLSEGEVAAEDLPDTDPVAEIAHRLTAEQEAFRKQNPQWAWTLLDTIKFVLAANTPPDGHVAVYLPAEVAREVASMWDKAQVPLAVIEACNEACRTALGVE